MITAFPEPCWHVINRHGQPAESGDVTPHYSARGDAVQDAADANEDDDNAAEAPFTAQQLTSVCYDVTCDRCESRLSTGDDYMNAHFTDFVSAKSDAEEADWQVETSAVLCDSCRVRTMA